MSTLGSRKPYALFLAHRRVAQIWCTNSSVERYLSIDVTIRIQVEQIVVVYGPAGNGRMTAASAVKILAEPPARN